jgi:tRNA threonylcarbamoyladenosine biosynthesis protein TsaB
VFTGSSAFAHDADMRVLAIDTALAVCATMVLDTARPGLRAQQSIPMVRGHAETLMPLIARVMDAAELEFSELDRIAVTTGPGSFTGLRVGIAAARGIALAAGKPSIGISTLSAFAAPLIAKDDRSPVVAAIDARHDQVYLQVFGVGGRTVVLPRVAPLQEAVRAAMGLGRVRVVGSAAKFFAAAWPTDEPAPLLVEEQTAPEIEWVARLGVSAASPAPPKPLYLRAADAQPQDAARLARR